MDYVFRFQKIIKIQKSTNILLKILSKIIELKLFKTIIYFFFQK